MPRPILKTWSSYATGTTPTKATDSAKKRGRKRVALRRHGGACRRVTFSPFAKVRAGTPTKTQPPLLTAADADEKSALTSGFTFSSVTEAEKRRQSRRKQELQTMQTLYNAARRRPHSVKSLLLANVPGLKKLNSWATDWLGYVKAVRNAISWPRRTRPKRRPRLLLRGPWTELDDADHEYVQQLALKSTMTHPTVLVPATAPTATENPLALAPRTPKPDLTPARRGSFVSLLRKEGVPVEEDEQKASRAIDEDLPGISRKRQRTSR